MTADRAALGRVADILETHSDHVWGRLPFLAAMASRADRERATPGRLTRLVTLLHDLLFSHLDREDRILLALARDPASPNLRRGALRLHAEHVLVTTLLDALRTELVGFTPSVTVGPTERALRAELADLDTHLREQMRLEEALLAA